MPENLNDAADELADAFFEGNIVSDFSRVTVNRQQLVSLLRDAVKLGRSDDVPELDDEILPDPNPLIVVSVDGNPRDKFVGHLQSLRFREAGVVPGDVDRQFSLVVGGEPESPEPALKAALLEDHDTHASAEDQSRDVLRRELAAAVGNSSYNVSPILAAVDRYVDSLPVEPTPQRRITLDDLPPRHPEQSDNEYRRMAVGHLVGAATVAWDSMQHTGVFHEATASSIIDALLELFDRQLSALPQAQVEYTTKAVNPDWKAAQQTEQDACVRRAALEQAVELVKAGVSPDMVETAAEAANKFHTFLTATTDCTETMIEIGGETMTEAQYDAARFALKAQIDTYQAYAKEHGLDLSQVELAPPTYGSRIN